MTDNGTLVLQSCTVALRAEHGLCSETSVQSFDDSNDVTTIKIVGDLVGVKEEDEPIAVSFSSIKEEPEVSPQAFHRYLGLPSNYAVLSVCLPFHINQLHVVNGNDQYVFPKYVKYECLKKTSSNVPARHITACCVQFNGALVQQHYIKNRSVFKCFLHAEIPLTQWKCHIEAV
jgi:hypothetical protein